MNERIGRQADTEFPHRRIYVFIHTIERIDMNFIDGCHCRQRRRQFFFPILPITSRTEKHSSTIDSNEREKRNTLFSLFKYIRMQCDSTLIDWKPPP